MEAPSSIWTTRLLIDVSPKCRAQRHPGPRRGFTSLGLFLCKLSNTELQPTRRVGVEFLLLSIPFIHHVGLCACLLGCIFMMGEFPSLIQCAQFAKSGVFEGILQKKKPTTTATTNKQKNKTKQNVTATKIWPKFCSFLQEMVY